MSGDTGRELLDVALTHPIKLIANVLGVPPNYMIEVGKERGIPVAALVGAKEHAVKQVSAGVDLIVAQGAEAGGHCGVVSTLVVVPEVLDALAAVGSTVPVRTAGGIVTGRQMASMAATSRDTVRSAGRTGEPSRQLVSDWTNAWTPNAGRQQPLPLPLQSMLCEPVIRRIDVLASQGHEGAQALATYFAGQGVGLMNKVNPAREVVREFIEDYLAAAERLNDSLPG